MYTHTHTYTYRHIHTPKKKRRVRPGEMADPYFLSSRKRPATPSELTLPEDGSASDPGGYLGDYKSSRFWRETVGGELYEPPESVPRSWEEQTLGLSDLAGVGVQSYEPGVTNPS